MATKTKNKTEELVAVVPKVLPPEAAQMPDQEDARTLDLVIDQKIQKAGNALALTYLDLAESLNKMKRTKGYRTLGFDNWEKYLQSKKTFGRAYLFFLAKLGQTNVSELRAYLDQGMTASKFIEYSKTSVLPEKIPQLIEKTWDEVKDKSTRETSRILRGFISEHADEFAKPKRTYTGNKPGRAKSPWQNKIQQQYEKLTMEDQKSYLAALREFVDKH